MSEISKNLFLAGLGDKLASDDGRTLPIAVGSGLALTGAGIPVVLGLSARRLRNTADKLRGQMLDLDSAIFGANASKQFAENRLQKSQAELERLSAAFDGDALQEWKIRDLKTGISEASKELAEAESQLQKIPEQIKVLKNKYTALPNKNWAYKAAKQAEHLGKFGPLVLFAGAPAALIAGGAGLAGYNLYKRRQENKPWYKN